MLSPYEPVRVTSPEAPAYEYPADTEASILHSEVDVDSSVFETLFC